LSAAIGEFSTRPDGWRRSAWSGGEFQAAHRPRTRIVEGVIRSDRHLVMATLRGGARRHVFRNADGRGGDGPDHPGAVSFLPAGCERRLRLEDVEWRWAAVALAPAAGDALGAVGSIALADDAFVASALAELERHDALCGGVEPLYGEAMAGALSAYLRQRYGGGLAARPRYGLAPWKLNRVKSFVGDNLSEPIAIRDLAALCGMSERHFHRAFLEATGETPYAHVTRRRLEQAKLLLATERDSVTSVALAVGYRTPTQFARAFAAEVGMLPSRYRRRSRPS
jgi:AraC family transcriptional regulator